MPEKFDFSKIEDQQKFENLPQEEKDKIVGEAQEEKELLKLKLYHLSDNFPKLIKTGVIKHKGTWSPDYQPHGFFTTENPKHCLEVMKDNKPLKEGEAVLEVDVEIETRRIWETSMAELRREYDKWIVQNYKKEGEYTAKQKWTDYLSEKYDAIIVNYPEDSRGWKREVIILEPSIIKDKSVKDSWSIGE